MIQILTQFSSSPSTHSQVRIYSEFWYQWLVPGFTKQNHKELRVKHFEVEVIRQLKLNFQLKLFSELRLDLNGIWNGRKSVYVGYLREPPVG